MNMIKWCKLNINNTNMKLLQIILSIPKSLYVSIKLCGFKKGIKLPVLVRYNTVLRDISGQVITPVRGRLSENP